MHIMLNSQCCLTIICVFILKLPRNAKKSILHVLLFPFLESVCAKTHNSGNWKNGNGCIMWHWNIFMQNMVNVQTKSQLWYTQHSTGVDFEKKKYKTANCTTAVFISCSFMFKIRNMWSCFGFCQSSFQIKTTSYWYRNHCHHIRGYGSFFSHFTDCFDVCVGVGQCFALQTCILFNIKFIIRKFVSEEKVLNQTFFKWGLYLILK